MLARRLAGVAWAVGGLLLVLTMIDGLVRFMPDASMLPSYSTFFFAAGAILLALSPQHVILRVLSAVWGVAMLVYAIAVVGFLWEITDIANTIALIAGIATAIAVFVPRRARGHIVWVVPAIALLDAAARRGQLIGLDEGGLLIAYVLLGLVALVGGILVALDRAALRRPVAA